VRATTGSVAIFLVDVDYRVRVGPRGGAGVVADDFEERPIVLNEARQRGLEVAHFAGVFRDRDRVDTRTPLRGDKRGGYGAYQPIRHSFLRMLVLHELLVEAGQCRHPAIHRNHAEWQSHWFECLPTPGGRNQLLQPPPYLVERHSAQRISRTGVGNAPGQTQLPSHRGRKVLRELLVSHRLWQPARMLIRATCNIWASDQRPCRARGSATASKSSSGNRAASTPLIRPAALSPRADRQPASKPGHQSCLSSRRVNAQASRVAISWCPCLR